MTRYRGYKENTSKSGATYKALEKPKQYGIVLVQDLLVRENPKGKVVDIVHEGDKLEILEELDSKWVQVTTPSGLYGVAGLQYLRKED